MSIFFSRPSSLPSVPRPAPALAGLEEIRGITPDFLSARAEQEGLSFFSSNGALQVAVSSPDAVHEVLVAKSHNFMKGDEEQALSAVIGWGLLGFDGEIHKSAHRQASPAFRAAALDRYREVIATVVENHIDSWTGQSNLTVVDTIRNLTQDIAEQSLFPGSKTQSDYSYQKAVSRLSNLMFSSQTSAIGNKSSFAKTQELRDTQLEIATYVQKLVKQASISPKSEPSLLSYISGVGEVSSDRLNSIHQQTSLFLQASIETTATLISWTLLLLNNNSEYWDRLENEAAPFRDWPISSQALKDLTLHSAVLNESLRLYPPVWMIPRITVEDTEIAGQLLPAATRVYVSPFVNHRMERYFTEPTKFHPERWVDSTIPLQRGVYFPFGLGGRICVGERLAKLVATMVLVGLTKSERRLICENPNFTYKTQSILLGIAADQPMLLRTQKGSGS